MKLYYDPLSTTSRPVMLFLAEHDLPVEMEPLDIMSGETRSPAFAALNPNLTVPVLDDDGFVLTESSAILKYLADLAGSPAYPTELRARARVNSAMDWFNTNFSKDLNGDYVYPRLLPELMPPHLLAPEVTQRALERAGHWLGVLDGHMLRDRYVCGPDITIADYSGAAQTGLSQAVDFDLSPWPRVKAWLERMQSRPAWGEVHAAFYGLVASRRQLSKAG